MVHTVAVPDKRRAEPGGKRLDVRPRDGPGRPANGLPFYYCGWRAQFLNDELPAGAKPREFSRFRARPRRPAEPSLTHPCGLG